MLVKLAMSNFEGKYKKRKGKLTEGMAVLQSLLEGANNPLSEQFLRWKMWMQWPHYVGASVAQNSMPVGYEKGRLYVWVKSSAWMHHMIFLKETMKDSINNKLGRVFVREIIFTLDRHAVPTSSSNNEMKEMLERIIPSSEDSE